MKNIFIKWLLWIILLVIPFFSYATDNVNITTVNNGTGKNTELDAFAGTDGKFFEVWTTTWEQWVKWLILNIAFDLKSIVFVFVLLLVVIMVIKLLFSENTEEQQKKLKLWILWSSIWLMVMQIAASVSKVVFDKSINGWLGVDFWKKIVEPFTHLLMLWASFIFIAMWIRVFYKMVTAGGNEEGIKKWKTTLIQLIIWFIVIKFSSIIVTNTFNPQCGGITISLLWTNVCDGKNIENIKDNTKIIFALINWFNTFLAVIIVIMIMYAGFLIMTGGWEEEKNKKAKKIILYSWIGLLILFASYMILTFFIIPESTI